MQTLSGSARELLMRAAAMTALALLAGRQKPSFDERYAEAEKRIHATLASIDKDLADRASEAAMRRSARPPPRRRLRVTPDRGAGVRSGGIRKCSFQAQQRDSGRSCDASGIRRL
jgi:hypothetical protein